jgi:hypothetical protein
MPLRKHHSESANRQHPRLSNPDVEVDSPLIDCRLLDLSTSGIGFETSIGLRLGVPYPFRLRDGRQTLGTEAVIRWCRLVRNETAEGESRPVYRAGASFVDWQAPEPMASAGAFEQQIDDTLDDWIERSRTGQAPAFERTIVHKAPRSPRR